jgi:hypothetical protein
VRSYFRVDPKMVERKLAAGYTPAQIGAFVMLLCQAEQQPQRGRFRSLVELRAAMDCMVEEAGPTAGMSKHVSFLLSRKDVVKLPEGPYYVDGWDEWQEGNWQVAERMRRVRERQTANGPITGTDTGPVTPPVTGAVTPVVTPPVTVAVTPDVTARDARSSAAAAAPNVAAAASRLAVSRQQQAASETVLAPLPLAPEVQQRVRDLDEGCAGILVRPLKAIERELVLSWASKLRRHGELVPVAEVLATVEREMARPTQDGTPAVNLGWVDGAVAALARSANAGSLSAMPRSAQEAVALDQVWAERAKQLRQEGR